MIRSVVWVFCSQKVTVSRASSGTLVCESSVNINSWPFYCWTFFLWFESKKECSLIKKVIIWWISRQIIKVTVWSFQWLRLSYESELWIKEIYVFIYDPHSMFHFLLISLLSSEFAHIKSHSVNISIKISHLRTFSVVCVSRIRNGDPLGCITPPPYSLTSREFVSILWCFSSVENTRHYIFSRLSMILCECLVRFFLWWHWIEY